MGDFCNEARDYLEIGQDELTDVMQKSLEEIDSTRHIMGELNQDIPLITREPLIKFQPVEYYP